MSKALQKSKTPMAKIAISLIFFIFYIPHKSRKRQPVVTLTGWQLRINYTILWKTSQAFPDSLSAKVSSDRRALQYHYRRPASAMPVII